MDKILQMGMFGKIKIQCACPFPGTTSLALPVAVAAMAQRKSDALLDRLSTSIATLESPDRLAYLRVDRVVAK